MLSSILPKNKLYAVFFQITLNHFLLRFFLIDQWEIYFLSKKKNMAEKMTVDIKLKMFLK
jgi:hypothetical protein